MRLKVFLAKNDLSHKEVLEKSAELLGEKVVSTPHFSFVVNNKSTFSDGIKDNLRKGLISMGYDPIKVFNIKELK